MSLEDKISEQFDGFTIKSPDPKKDHPWHLEHLHADFVELRALLWDKNSFLTLQDAITFYKDFEFNIDFEETHSIEDMTSSSVSEKNDKWVSKFKEIFGVIEERYLIYEDSYPFEIDGFKIKLKENLNDVNKLYLYLLISSNLNNFSKLENVLTNEFETLSKLTLEGFFPGMTVEEFGQNSEYKGNTINKIKALSTKLKVKSRITEIEQIAKIANKEKGLDIIGWQNFRDNISNMLIILGQCACGKNWVNKRGDTGDYEDSYLDFHRLKPIHAMFIPYGLIRYSDTLFQSDNTNGRLIFERKRILDVLIPKINIFKDMASFKIVEKCIDFDEVEI